MAAIGELPCKVIDTSTAFRTAADWAYGFPELGADYKTAISTENILLIQDVVQAA